MAAFSLRAQAPAAPAQLPKVIESIDVVASPEPIDPAETAERQHLSGSAILAVPYPAPQDLRNSLTLFQGVVQDSHGQLHFNGGRAEQANFRLDGFNLSDPVTGLFEARLSIDAVRSLDLEAGRFSADRGGGSSAAVDIRTGMGDDRWRVSGANFFPGVSAQRGLLIHQWTPRATLSGPLVRGRAWFSTSLETFYDVDIVRELPRDQDRRTSLTTSSLARFQVNLTPAHILTGSLLANYSGVGRAGLSFLDPLETTTSRRRHFFMSSLKHQAYFRRGALLEFGFAASRSLLRHRPRGDAIFEISPSGRRGNYFVDLAQDSERQQFMTQAFLPAFRAGGSHQFKLGLDAQRSAFRETVRRRPYRVLRADGSAARSVVFSGEGARRKADFQPAVYVMDRWMVREGVVFEAGLRGDGDSAVGEFALSPRFAVALAPKWMRETKLSAGFGVFRDALSLGALTRYQDQASVATFFSRAGAVVRGPIETAFVVHDRSLRIPRAQMLSFGIERKLPGDFYGRAGYIRRVGRAGLGFVQHRLSGSRIVYSLRNRASERYDAVEFAARRSFPGRFEWFGGYAYSRARSDAVIEYSLEDPIFADQGPGPLAWDAPHRFLTWGWAPLPRRCLVGPMRALLRETTLAWLAESRSGFPFSAVNEEGFLAGRPNGRRFPAWFSLNLHLERKFRVWRTAWAWRFGFNNITNHRNPNVVNNNVDSPEFLSYGGGQRRAFSLRLRFLGR